MGDSNFSAAALPESVVVDFQVVSLGKNPANNYRYQLHDDGRYHYVQHSGELNDIAIDGELPSEPTRHFEALVVDNVKFLLNELDFVRQDVYQDGAASRGGSYAVVTARVDYVVHQVTYRNVSNELTTYLKELTQDQATGSGETKSQGFLASLFSSIFGRKDNT